MYKKGSGIIYLSLDACWAIAAGTPTQICCPLASRLIDFAPVSIRPPMRYYAKLFFEVCVLLGN